MEHQIQQLKEALAQAQAIVDGITTRLRAIETRKHEQAITADVPAGWDTVLGYLAKFHPEVLDCFDYTKPASTARDGWWLSHQCQRRGIEPRYVEAPACLKQHGITSVRIYPVSLLALRWG